MTRGRPKKVIESVEVPKDLSTGTTIETIDIYLAFATISIQRGRGDTPR